MLAWRHRARASSVVPRRGPANRNAMKVGFGAAALARTSRASYQKACSPISTWTFAPITRIGSFTLMMVINPSIPVKTLPELVAYAKANPGKLTYGSGNTSGILAGETLKRFAGIDILQVPYKSVPPALTDVLATVEAVAGTGVPVLVMTYWNPVDHYGVAAFARDLAAAGGSGLITPDLTPEEAGPWLAAARDHDLDRVFLVAPSSSERRIALITQACRGFVYAASLMGTTGTRASVGSQAAGLVGRVRQHTSLPRARR